MKPNRKNLFLAASAAFTVALAAPSAQAVNLYWDTNGTGVSGSGAATGTWGTDAFWSTDSTGNNVGPVTLTAATTGVDDLFFSAGTTGTGGTVTVNTSRTARKLTFEEGAITLSGGTLITLAGGGGLTVNAAAGNAIVSTALTATGNNTFNVGAGRTLTLDTGAFTRTTRGALNVQLGAGSTLTSTKTGLATGGMVNGIIGPWASIGTGASTQYATFTGNNITALTGTAAATAANVTDLTGTFNYDVAATGAFAANASVNTIRYTGATGGTLTSTTSFTTKGIMLTGASNLTLLGGAGWSSGASATELVVNVVQATSELRMNGATAAITGSINKTGAGIFDMRSGAAHSIGNITVNEGILITNHLNGDGIGGSATINSGGTLRWGGGSKHQNAAAFTINAGGTLDIQGFDDLIGSISGAGNITGTTGRIQVQNATATFSGVMSGSGVRFLINDDGATNDYTLSGLNTYGGTTTLERGILRINSIGNVNGSASSVGTPTSIANGNIAIGRLGFTGTLVYTGTGHGTDRQITIGTNTAATALNTDTGGATIEANGASNAALTFSATTFNTQTNASAGAGADRVLTLQGTSTGLNTISGIIQDNLVSGTATGTAKVGVTKAQAGTWVLSGANTYSGATTISAGTLRLGAAGVIPDGAGKGDVSVTGTLDLNGFSETINGLSGGGTVDNAAASTSATLTVGGGGTFSGSITDSGTSASLALVKSGSGADLILSGNNNYSGGTTLNSGGAGRLFIASSTALPTTGAVQVNSGATLNINAGGSPTFNQSITLASGATLAVRQAATLGNVTLPTSGSVIFNNDDQATVAFSLGNNVGLTGNLTVQVGGNNATVGAVTLGGVISGSGVGLTKTQIGTLTLSGVSTYTGDTLINNGTLALTSTGGLKFEIGASGTNNKITGAGTVSLDGMFTFDLTSAGTTVNDMWNIVDNGMLTESYGSNFAVAGFSNIGGGLWNKDNGGTIYQFSTGTGVLTVIPEPNVAALIGAFGGILLLRRRR